MNFIHNDGNLILFKPHSFSTYSFAPPFLLMVDHPLNSVFGITNSCSTAICQLVSTSLNILSFKVSFRGKKPYRTTCGEWGGLSLVEF
jgi:hypothetical protein